MAILGSTKRPAVARVRTQKRALEILDLCQEHKIKAVVGIEPDKAEDIGDVEVAIARLKARVANAKIGRRKPFPSGSDKYSEAPVPQRRVDFSTLPELVQRLLHNNPQGAAFADAEFTVDYADIRRVVVGAGGLREMAKDAEVGDVEQRPAELSSINILLHLSAVRDSQGARRDARAGYSFSTTVTGLSIHIKRGDTVRLTFVAGFKYGDDPNNPSSPWSPIVLDNLTSGEYVFFGTAPDSTIPRPITLKVASVLMLVTGSGLAVAALHRLHRFSLVAAALGCIALAYLLKRAMESAKRQLERITQLARDYPV
jgi:hypothetical protein